MRTKEETTLYYKDYYRENTWRYNNLHALWIKENKEKWNKYQSWHCRLRYWKKKVQMNPENEAFVLKLNLTYSERPN